MAEAEGRSCPLAYRYSPSDLCSGAEKVTEDVLYIIGGLYGNPFALDRIEAMALEEEQQGHRVRLVFNGDFNWFNANDHLFRDINNRVLAHSASLGNVEYELANPSEGAGCGCAYPDFVDEGVVARSNHIIKRMQALASQHRDIQQRLAQLPRYRTLIFGGLKILVVHGDPESLAGWGLAHETFQSGHRATLADWFALTGADVIASTHTCLPALWSGQVSNRPCVIANNGAAGMGNLARDPRGLITRLGFSSPDTKLLATADCGSVTVSLMPVAFDLDAWLSQFDQLWPTGSPASVSYRNRIRTGTGLGASDLVFSG